MKTNKIVSVIVPVYNAERTLKDCIDSVLSQSYAEFEVILVNDGSTDKSWEICNSLKSVDNRIRIFNQKNSGAASARNKGIEQAKGDFILFVDSDDRITPCHIENLIQNSDYDIVSTSFVQQWINCNRIWMEKETSGIGNDKVISYFANCDILETGSSCNKLFKKEIIDHHGLRYPTNQFDVGEDHIFVWSYLLHCNSFKNVNGASYIYLENLNSLSHEKAINNPTEFIEKRLRLYQNLINTLMPVKSTKYYVDVLRQYRNHFMDLIVRNLYIQDLISEDRYKVLREYKRLNRLARAIDFGYPDALFNRILWAGCFWHPAISDVYFKIVFKLKKLLCGTRS